MLSDVWLIFPTVEAVEAADITELMLSIELLGDARSVWPLIGILFPDLDGIVLLISDFDDERTGILWAVLFLLLMILVSASGLVDAAIKGADFEIEMDFVPPTDLTLAEVLVVLPAACLLTTPPVLLLLSGIPETVAVLVDDLIPATLGRALRGFEVFASAAPGNFTLAAIGSFGVSWALSLPRTPWLAETGALILG